MKQLSGMDASFLYLETPTTPMHIGSVAIYDPSTAPNGFVRFKDILRFIESRLGGARSFRERLVRVPLDLDHPYWINDPDFDIEYHVRHIALPAPGDWRQLCIQAARLHSRPMDLSKPLWEFTIVEGLDNIEGLPPGCFALVSKVHHAAIDGMSGVEMTAAVHDLTADTSEREIPDAFVPDSRPGIGELLISSYFNTLRKPFQYAEVLGQTLPGLARLSKGISRGEVSIAGAKPAPDTRFNAKVGAHRVLDGHFMKLTDIRRIKDAVEGATVNDVILTIIGGGLRTYLEGKAELPEETLTAMAPISVRAEDAKAAMGNQVSAMVVPLGTHIAEPLERLRFVRQETANSKAMTNAVGAKTLSDYSQLIPAGLAGLAARLYVRTGAANSHAPVYNVVATNVPGSRVPLYFAGARMVKMFGMGPVLDSMGLINTIYSYGDEIVISFTACRDMLPDPAVYAEAIKGSFEALRDAVLPASPISESSPSTGVSDDRSEKRKPARKPANVGDGTRDRAAASGGRSDALVGAEGG